MILSMLREAREPMMTRDIVLAVMTACDLTTAEKVMHETIRMRVGAPLRGMRDWGSVTSSEGLGASVLWTLSKAT